MVPSQYELAVEFERDSQAEPAGRYLAEVYRTGVMYNADAGPVVLNDTSLGLSEGRVFWHLARSLRPDLIIETGFGRGGSAAFFLSAMAPWGGRLCSIDPAFRHWADGIGETYIAQLGLSANHTLLERPSEVALASMISQDPAPRLKLSYIDGSHHFDGTLIDFTYLDRMTEVGGIIAIDDAHSPAVRTVASFVAHNLPYQLHFPTPRLVLCMKTAQVERDWAHFRPFQSSPNSDWNVHADRPYESVVPGATYGD